MTTRKNEPDERVTYCKDCVFLVNSPELMPGGWAIWQRGCSRLGIRVDEDFYCKYATSRSEEV